MDPAPTLPPEHLQFRLRAVGLLAAEGCAKPRALEHAVYAGAHSAAAYEDKVKHLAAALCLNERLRLLEPGALVGLDDAGLAAGLPIAQLAAEQRERDAKQAAALAQEDAFLSGGGGTAAFLVCSKCKATTVAVEQKQTRSADEGMTVFCRCMACGHKWKM